MTPTQQLILDYLQGATSVKPKTAPEIYTNSGVKSILIQPALDWLFDKGYVNRCKVTKGSQEYMEYWPTGFKGPAMTKDPILAAGKEPKARSQEPASWAALKQSKSENNEGIDMADKPFKASQIREILNVTDMHGISHQDLVLKLVGTSTDKDLIRKASDMITYTINAGGYTKRNETAVENGHTVKRYYKNSLVSHANDAVALSKPKLTEVKTTAAKSKKPKAEKPTVGEITAIPDVLQPFVEAAEQINAAINPSALNSQVGGDHYKKLGIYQPWEVFKRWMTPEEFKGAMKKEVITYLAREQDKGGREDIEKAMHTMQIYLELTA